jgi:hypothetical protein
MYLYACVAEYLRLRVVMPGNLILHSNEIIIKSFLTTKFIVYAEYFIYFDHLTLFSSLLNKKFLQIKFISFDGDI